MRLANIINKLGSIEWVAEQLGCQPHNIYLARNRNKLPLKYWGKFVSLCTNRGVEISIEDLYILSQQRG